MNRYYRPLRAVEVIIDFGGATVEVWGRYQCTEHARQALPILIANGFPARISRRVDTRSIGNAIDELEP